MEEKNKVEQTATPSEPAAPVAAPTPQPAAAPASQPAAAPTPQPAAAHASQPAAAPTPQPAAAPTPQPAAAHASRPSSSGEGRPQQQQRPYRGGPRPRRRKVCQFCVDRQQGEIDYKDTAKLRKFISERAKIIPRRVTGTCAHHQREMTVAIKRARHVALLPYVSD